MRSFGIPQFFVLPGRESRRLAKKIRGNIFARETQPDTETLIVCSGNFFPLDSRYKRRGLRCKCFLKQRVPISVDLASVVENVIVDLRSVEVLVSNITRRYADFNYMPKRKATASLRSTLELKSMEQRRSGSRFLSFRGFTNSMKARVVPTLHCIFL